MRLNTLKPASGSKQKARRLGRGMGSGFGKTCGHGHKGAKARSGYSRGAGFIGGQLPLQRRLPKFGFNSLKAKGDVEIQLRNLNKIKATRIDMDELRKANLIGSKTIRAKIILAGKIDKAITLIGVRVTAGAKKAIEASGGKVE